MHFSLLCVSAHFLPVSPVSSRGGNHSDLQSDTIISHCPLNYAFIHRVIVSVCAPVVFGLNKASALLISATLQASGNTVTI